MSYETLNVYEIRNRNNWKGADSIYDAYCLIVKKPRDWFNVKEFEKVFPQWRKFVDDNIHSKLDPNDETDKEREDSETETDFKIVCAEDDIEDDNVQAKRRRKRVLSTSEEEEEDQKRAKKEVECEETRIKDDIEGEQAEEVDGDKVEREELGEIEQEEDEEDEGEPIFASCPANRDVDGIIE